MGKTDIYHFFEFNENTQAEIVWKTIDKIKKLEKELAHEIDMNAQGRAKIETINIDDAIDNFISILDFDQIIAWANLLDVEVNYPPTSEMYPDWENELAVEVGDAMRKVGKKG